MRTLINSFTWRFWRRCSSSRFSAWVSLQSWVSVVKQIKGSVALERCAPVHIDV